MKKGKNIVKSIFSTIALCGIVCGGAIIGSGKETCKSLPASAYTEISNSVPEYVKTQETSGPTPFDTYAFVDNDINDYAHFSFSVGSNDNVSTGERTGVYFDGEKYYAFVFGPISTFLNGEIVSDINYSDTIHLYEPDPTWAINSLSFLPESLNLYLSVDKSLSAAEMQSRDPAPDTPEDLLVLPDQGLVQINVSYTLYELSLNEGSNSFNVENLKTNQSVTYDFFLLDSKSYLEVGTKDSPNVSYSDNVIKTASGSPTYKYNYFYNNTTDHLPSITYNLENYELSVLEVGLNNTYITNTIKYNPVTGDVTIYDENENVQLSPSITIKKEGKDATVYFQDLGQYILQYKSIFVNENTIYSINLPLANQKFFVYGFQNFYTAKSAVYNELKNFNEDKTAFTTPSDISYLFDPITGLTYNDGVIRKFADLSFDYVEYEISLNKIFGDTPVNNTIVNNLASTNQTPIKFKTIEGVVLSDNSAYFFRGAGDTNWEKADFSVANNYSAPGTYFFKLIYTFASYTSESGIVEAGRTFTQYFAFEVTKTNPTIDVYYKDDTAPTPNNISLSDGAYTNKNVFLHFAEYNNVYNKAVTIELVKYDYNNKTTSRETIDWKNNGSLYTLDTVPGTVMIASDGNYTVNIRQQGSTNPIVRSFNIDTDTNFHLSSYSIEKSSATQNNYASTKVEYISNQSLVFSWDNVKPSGATTQAYYKYYPISATDLGLTGVDLFNYVDKKTIPVQYTLNLSASANWLQYSNFEYEKNRANVVPSMYIKSNAGLYVVQSIDEAGNSQTQLYILDTMSPTMLLEKITNGVTSYETLNRNDTITTDAKVIWGKQKIIKIANSIDLDDDNLALYKNKAGNYDPDIFAALSQIRSDDNLANANPKVNISFLYLPNRMSEHSSNYLCVDIEDDVYFKNYNASESEYVFISGAEHDYSYDIISSYSLVRTKDTGKFYRSTSQYNDAYISVENNTDELTYESPSNLDIMNIYVYQNTRYLVSYNNGTREIFYQFDPALNRIGAPTEITEVNGKKVFAGNILTKVDFIDKEGTYSFLLRDKANLAGSTLGKRNQYLSFPSAYEFIKVTGDQSQLRTYFIDKDGTQIDLLDSSYVQVGNKKDALGNEIIEGVGEAAKPISQKSTYFSPTNEGQLYISFIPTFDIGGAYVQVKEVVVEYYEFETQNYEKVAMSGGISVNYFKTLPSEPTWETTIYSHTDSELESGEPFVYVLNENNGATKNGFYKISRSYMTNANKGDDTKEYVITAFDYQERIMNAYVDRFNVLTQSETINPNLHNDTLTATYDESGGADPTAKKHVFALDIFYSNDKKLLYIPVNASTDSLLIKAVDKDEEYSVPNVDTLVKFEFDGLSSRYSLSAIAGLAKNFIDSNGTRYLLLDMTQGGLRFTEGYSVNYITGFKKVSWGDSSSVMLECVKGDTTETLTFDLGTTPGIYSTTSTQSLVGGAMLVKMYSSYKSDATIVSLSHPSQVSSLMLSYGSGDSFYTKENTANITTLTSLFNTNKLPVEIAIPKYKFTTHFTTSSSEVNGYFVSANTVYETDILSYYGLIGENLTAEQLAEIKTNSMISSYELEVVVKYFEGEVTDGIPTKTYRSNGLHKNGYLNLYEYDAATDTFGNIAIKDFTQAGNYVVEITQAPFEVEASSYNFKSTYAFRFTVEKNLPEFSLYSGTLLKSVADTKYYTDENQTTSLPNQNMYFTNQNEVSAIWTDTTSPYKANIDKKEIIFVANGSLEHSGTYKISLTEPNNIEITKLVGSTYRSTWDNATAFKSAFTYNFTENTLSNTLTYNLATLGLKRNGASSNITMKFVGHDDAYYLPTSKTICYDQTASFNTINALYNLLQDDKVYPLQMSDIREYYMSDAITTTLDPNLASYNQTISNGTYANYAYVVDTSFFEALKDTVGSNLHSNLYTETTSAYYRLISDYSTYRPTSNTYDFVESEFSPINEAFNLESINIQKGKYYEIVERDLANNMTVYVVYIYDKNGTFDFGIDEVENGIVTNLEYFDELGLSHPVVINDKTIETGKYNQFSSQNSSNDFEIEEIKYQGDEWNYFYTSIYSSSLGKYYDTYYLMTPDLEKGYVYEVSGLGTKTYTRTPISNLFKNSEGRNKNYIYILNKLTGTYNKIEFSLSNSATLDYIVGEIGNNEVKSAYLSIYLPAAYLSNANIIYAQPERVSIRNTTEDIGGVKSPYFFDKTNLPNNIANLQNPTYNFLNEWLSLGDNNVDISYANDYLTFTIPNIKRNTKLEFTITDSFGRVRTELYLVGETKVEEITSDGNLYTFFAKQKDGEYENTYISPKNINVNFNTSKYAVKATILSAKTSINETVGDASGVITSLSAFSKESKKSFFIKQSDANEIRTWTFESDQTQYDITIKIDFVNKDDTDEVIKTYYIRLYNMLPKSANIADTNNDQYFAIIDSNGSNKTNELLRERSALLEKEYKTIAGKTYEIYSSNQTFSDTLQISYSNQEDLDFKYEVLYFCDNQDWGQGQDFIPLRNGITLKTNGVYYILVRYQQTTPLTKEYYLFKIEILGSSGVPYYVLGNGEVREKAATGYVDKGKQYSDYYIININHADRSIKDKFEIVVNDYQEILCFQKTDIIAESVSAGIYTYSYIITNYHTAAGRPTTAAEADGATIAPTAVDRPGISPYKQTIYVTFLNPSKNILSVSEESSNLSYTTNDIDEGKSVTVSTSSVNMFVPETSPDTNTFVLKWRKYYGIQANLITAEATKDGKPVYLTIHENASEYYVNLTKSGYYSFKFKDTAGNIQSFYSGQNYLPVIFVKDVHFTMVYEDPMAQNEKETEVINKAVYNNAVKLKINKLLVPYYQASSFGDGNIITATRNGAPYTGFTYSNADFSFTFSETGYYQVYMTCNAKETGQKLRSETYSFTIINPRESRYAYEFSKYQSYYVKSVIKDGMDMTNLLVESLKTSSNYTLINEIEEKDGNVTSVEKTYLTELLLSAFDDKTGQGVYQITICSNDEVYFGEQNSYTFSLYINSQTVPINISVPDGASTKDAVSVEFNAKNVYEAVGECYIIVGKDTYYVNDTTVDNVKLILGDNESRTTHFIQVYSMSGNLLFSHKVVLGEPMNAWAIIAIIGGSIAVIGVVLIIIKLRKRMNIK